MGRRVTGQAADRVLAPGRGSALMLPHDARRAARVDAMWAGGQPST